MKNAFLLIALACCGVFASEADDFRQKLAQMQRENGASEFINSTIENVASVKVEVEKPVVSPAPAAEKDVATWVFLVADYNGDRIPDLWCIKRTHTGSGHTELHILDGKEPTKYLLHSATALNETPEEK